MREQGGNMSSAISGISNTGAATGTHKTKNAASAQDALLDKASAKQADPAEELIKYSNMSIADKIRYQYLKKHHLSEDALNALPPEEREKIEKEIADEIKRALKAKGEHAERGAMVNVVT